MKLLIRSMAFVTASLIVIAMVALGSQTLAATEKTTQLDYLVKFNSEQTASDFAFNYGFSPLFRATALASSSWVRIQISANQSARESVLQSLVARQDIRFIEENSKLRLLDSSSAHDHASGPVHVGLFDNPAIPELAILTKPAPFVEDPLTSRQWGMIDIGASAGWDQGGGKGIVVAVIDSGVDYTHEDLRENIWRNPGETGADIAGLDRSKNGVDDDSNGYIDDVIGWDFASGDNKPYDVTVPGIGPLLGKNAGHGTHCAGTIAAVRGNGLGISGVAPNAKVMALRFMDENGTGGTDAAVNAINYAVANGARIISNSWGTDGDASDLNSNLALREAIQNAEAHGVLFIGVAGNGRANEGETLGFDNDGDPKASLPGSFSYSNIISVAALDKDDQLAPYSNWGLNSVHLGAPGVRIFSTMVGSHYGDVKYKLIGIREFWEGTSMATPFVAGAAAVYWAKYPRASYLDVKKAILSSVVPIPALKGRVSSGGKLNIKNLMAD